MKKVFLTFATYAVILTSCNQNEITDNLETSSNGQLTFSPAIGKQTATRASELTNAGLETAAVSKEEGIVLYAYQETGGSGTYSTWFNDKLWYEAPNWKIGSTRFRNTSKSKFISFYPKTNQLKVDSDFEKVDFVSNFPQFVYNASTNLSEQEDLVASITDVEPNATDIVFKMKHILSQVNFGVKGYKGAKISIQSINVKDVKAKGTYAFNSVEEISGTDIIGKWTPKTPASYNYDFPIYTVPNTAATGDIYVFGDGGNWGPGTAKTTWYVIDESTAIQGNAINNRSYKRSNSLMLIPQDLTGATVKFTYTIQDKDGAYVAGKKDVPATGVFKLDFKTGNTSGTHYLGKWEQNYRYLYIIDFTDFLNDNKLTFKVDVEAYPWENYNKNDSDDGIVDVPVIGQTTNEAFDTPYTGIEKDIVWYAATCSRTSPKNFVQLINSETWSWELYTFKGLDSSQSFNIKFDKVIFNGKNITINVGAGYKIYKNNESETGPETQPETDSQSVNVYSKAAVVTIEKI